MAGIIDVHVHCSNRTDDLLNPYAKLNGLRYDLDELLSLMKKHRIRKGLLLGSILRGGECLGPEETVTMCERSEGMLLPVFTTRPNRRTVLDGIAAAKRHRGFVKAFKVMLGYHERFAADPVYAPLYRYAGEAGLPVMFHTGDTATSGGSLAHAHPLTLDPVAIRYPDLKVVVCHVGNPWIGDAAELVYKHRNAYADISGLVAGGGKYSERYIATLTRRLSEAIFFAGGADKFLFGTDYPVETHETALRLVRSLEIDVADREKILWKNAERVFSI